MSGIRAARLWHNDRKREIIWLGEDGEKRRGGGRAMGARKKGQKGGGEEGKVKREENRGGK